MVPKSAQKLCSRGGLGWQPRLVMPKSHPGGTSFENMTKSPRAPEFWRCERPLVKVYPQWQLKAQNWRNYGEKLRVGTMKRAYERLLAKEQPRCSKRLQHFGDASPMGRSLWTAPAVTCSQWILEEKLGGAREVAQALWRSLEDHEWLPDIGHWVIFS